MRVLIIAIMLQGLALAGDTAGHGGGVAEKNLVFVHLELPRYAEFCLSSGNCRLTDVERKTLTEIRNSHMAEGAVDRQIVFDSEKEHPGFFLLDGQVRIAKTGSAVGDRIYVNRDMLYTKGPDAVVTALSVGGAAALLVHELGHHHGIADHTALDLLGSKVQQLLSQRTQELNGGPGWRHVDVAAISPPDVTLARAAAPTTQLLVGDGEQVFDYTRDVVAIVDCGVPGAEVANVYLWNLHWSGGVGGDSLHPTRDLQGRLQLLCRRGDAFLLARESFDLRVTLGFTRPTAKGVARLQPRATARQISCTGSQMQCH